jgi:hypothetical protein
MGLLPRADGMVVLACDRCSRYLQTDGRRSLLPVRLARRDEMSSLYHSRSETLAWAETFEWQCRGNKWLCTSCLAEATE